MDKGGEVIAIANDEADYQLRFRRKNIRFINIPIDHKGKNPFADFLFTLRLVRIYRRESPDLVHHFTIKPIIFGSFAAKLASVGAIINTVTGLGYVFEKSGMIERIVTWLYSYSLSGRTRTIFQNHDDYRFFVSKGVIRRGQAHVILGSGINTKQVCPGDNKKGAGRNLTFLMVSRMLWSKGIREFLGAAEQVKKIFPKTNFIMVGDVSGGGAEGNPEAIPTQWLNEVTSRGFVRWLGRVSNSEVMELMDKSDVVVLPSYYPEGIPRSLLEAAAKGKAIITADTRGCREVVLNGLNGFLVRPRDVDSLAKAMIQLTRYPDLIRRMGRESRRRARELFEESKVLAQTIEVYEQAGLYL